MIHQAVGVQVSALFCRVVHGGRICRKRPWLWDSRPQGYEARLSGNTDRSAKAPPLKERLIQGFLFLCGAISILTTLGIVYELSKESLSFFTRQLWEDTNKRLVVDVDSEADPL